MKILFLDTETTGNVLGQDRLVSVAYKTGDRSVHELFKPPRGISIEAMATHHITEEMVADKPLFSDSKTKDELAKMLADHVLVAHNAAFDIAMLEAEGLTVPQFVCTLKVSRALDEAGQVPKHSLQYLRYYWKLPVSGKSIAHSADGDVLVLETLFSHLQEIMRQKFSDDKDLLSEMMEISTKPSLIHLFHFGKYRGQRIIDVAESNPGYLEWLISEKEAAAKKGEGFGDDVDLLYSLRYFLGRSLT